MEYLKINNTNYNFDENINVKIVSPNFSLKDYAYSKDEISSIETTYKN